MSAAKIAASLRDRLSGIAILRLDAANGVGTTLNCSPKVTTSGSGAETSPPK
jgi:hypothetical protein